MERNGHKNRISRFGLAQTNPGGDVEENLRAARASVDAAVALGVQLLAFPEVFLFVGPREEKLRLAQPLDGPWVSEFRELAAKNGLWILMGSFHERIDGRNDRVHNTSVLIDDKGNLAAVYRKLRLFDLDLPDLTVRESDTILPGDRAPPVVESPFGRLGLTICFDMRYPELFQQLRGAGADVVFVPSNFTVPTGAAHWEPLLRARAIENQMYIAAPAQVGHRGSAGPAYGHTALIDPWGVITAMAPEKPSLTVGEIDLNHIDHVRRILPV